MDDNAPERLCSGFIEQSKLSYCERIDLWWFHHSTPTGELSYSGKAENIYCEYLNCCPGSLEIKFDKYGCKKEKICLMGCCAFYFI